MGIKIFIVDDDPDFAEGLDQVLSSEGYAVEVAHHAAGALQALEQSPADLALIDLRLGRKSGLDGFVTISISSLIMLIEVNRQATTQAAMRHAVKA